MVTNNILILG